MTQQHSNERIAMKYLMDNEMVEYLVEHAISPLGENGKTIVVSIGPLDETTLYELVSEKFFRDEGSYGHFEMVIKEYSHPTYILGNPHRISSPNNDDGVEYLLILPHDIHGGHPDAMNISESLAENHSTEHCCNV